MLTRAPVWSIPLCIACIVCDNVMHTSWTTSTLLTSTYIVPFYKDNLLQTTHLAVLVHVKTTLTEDNNKEKKKKEKKVVDELADDWRIRPHAPMRSTAYHPFPVNMDEIQPWKPEDDDPPAPRQTPNVSTPAMLLDAVLSAPHSSVIMLG